MSINVVAPKIILKICRKAGYKINEKKIISKFSYNNINWWDDN